MPGLRTVPSRRRRVDDDEDEDDESQPSASREATPSSQASNNSKRIRLTSIRSGGDGNDDSSEEGSGDEADSSAQAGQSRTDPLAPGNGISATYDSNGYRTGAIVRVKLTDFVTYTSVEFFPGPKLNMVIGPNGTGKSTLVCAICLGLGWGPQVCQTR